MKLTVEIAEQSDGQVAIDIKGIGVCSPREAPVLAAILNGLTFAITNAPDVKVLERQCRDVIVPLGNPTQS